MGKVEKEHSASFEIFVQKCLLSNPLFFILILSEFPEFDCLLG